MTNEELTMAISRSAEAIKKDIQPNELLDCITNLQEENEFLKLNNPEMNMEHFRIIKENKRKIDNLRKENKRLKEEKIQLESKIKQLEHNCKQASDSCRQHRLASKNHIRRLERREQQINIYKSRNEKAIEFLEHFDSGQQCEHTKDLAIIVENILQGEDKE